MDVLLPIKNLSLRDSQPSLVIYNEIVKTSRPFLRNVSIIEEAWLQEFAPVAQVKLQREAEKTQQLSRRRTTEVDLDK